MIDTHCHLTDTRLHSQLPDVLQRSKAAGVTQLITIGTELEDDRRAVEVCQNQPDIRCAVGVHPNYVDQVELTDMPQLRQIQSGASVVALGEMGLDYHYGRQARSRQMEFFHFQLQLAAELNRACVIHCREAVDDCLAVMRGYPTVRAVFHCFTGTPEEAVKVLDAGYMLGFTGVVTFKNSGDLRRAVFNTPIDRLLVETDAPYLAPEPFRKQKVNEPALVMHTAAIVAKLKEVTIEELDRQTTKNATALFGWPFP